MIRKNFLTTFGLHLVSEAVKLVKCHFKFQLRQKHCSLQKNFTFSWFGFVYFQIRRELKVGQYRKVEKWNHATFLSYLVNAKEGYNWGHGLSAAIKVGTPESKSLQSGCKLTCSQQSKTFVWHLINKWFYQKRLQMV